MGKCASACEETVKVASWQSKWSEKEKNKTPAIRLSGCWAGKEPNNRRRTGSIKDTVVNGTLHTSLVPLSSLDSRFIGDSACSCRNSAWV